MGKANLQRCLRHAVVQTWMISSAAVLIAAIPVDHTRGGELMDCEPQLVRGDGRHWAYRIIDGRECWYPGARGKPKDELRWTKAPSATQESGVLEQPDVEASPPAPARQRPSEVEQAEVAASRPEPTLDPAAASPEPHTIKVMPEEWRAAAADQLLAFTCCWPELPTAVSVPQPGPGGRQDQPPAWPLILLPLALCAMWSKKLRRLVAPDFGLSSVSSWWRWWGAHYVSGGRRAQRPADGVSPAHPPSAQLPTKLASIEGALVPLAPCGLPPASLGSLGSSRSSAKAGDWGRMKFILTD
jgi:hypothetical protein